MYRSVYADIEGMVFHDLASLNEAVGKSLEAFNSRKMSGRKESRRELFEEVEKGYLQPLPAVRYQMKTRKTATVLKNSYVMLNRHHYSVPKEYIGKRVDIIYDADTLQIFHGLKLVTVHQRDDTPYAYTQKEAHNLPGRHGSYEKDLEEILRQYNIELVILARYMQVLSADFCSRWKNRVINIHHGFLPAFKGAKPYHQAWQKGVKIIGATGHFATADLDQGPIIFQDVIRVADTCSVEEFTRMGKDVERRVLYESVRRYLSHSIFFYSGRTFIIE